MKFYRLDAYSNSPMAGMVGAKRGTQPWGREVRDILPGSYEIDVWYSAKRWPDYMDSLDCVLWSERVVNVFQELGLSGVEFYPQKLRNVDSKVLQRLPDSHYHWAHALSGVPAVPGDLEVYPKTEDGYINSGAFDFSQVVPYQINTETGFYDLSKKSGVCLWKFDFSHWQGADLFYISTVHTRHRYCTQRFKDLVESHKFTNFRFTGALNPEGDWFFA